MLGDIISHYRILEELGHGGMGSVYKALDLNLDRIVAIKFLPLHMNNNLEALKRFNREAKSASALDHQNIGAIHEIAEAEDGRMFIVMACYEGETLRTRMERGQIAIEEAIDYVSQIASGLAMAHEKGIVHRDIKPSNIIITKSGQIKIIDFGIAKLTDATVLTGDYGTLGTAAYMSPEQVEGKDVDQRSDIFSLGVLLYEMLAGLNPFKAEHQAASFYKVINESPKPVVEYRAECPPKLQEILKKAMNKTSADRYQDIGEMIRDLAEMTGIPAVRGYSLGKRSSHSIRKRTLVLFVVLLIVASTVVLIKFSDKFGFVTKEIPTIAIVDFRSLSDSADSIETAMLSSLLHVSLCENSPIRVISPDYIYDLHRRKFGSASSVISKNQVLDLARSADATCYLYGEIGHQDNKAVVFWRLIDTSSGNSIVSQKVENNVISEIADEIILEIIPELASLYNAGYSGKEISHVTDMTTNSPEAYRYYVAGILAYEHFYRRDALINLEKAIEIDSTFALAYLDLSMIYQRLRDDDTASHYLELADLFRDKLDAKAKGRLDATIMFIRGEPDQAFKIYEEHLTRWPDDRSVIRNYCHAKMSYDYCEDAIETGLQGLALYPGDQVIIQILTTCYHSTIHCEEGLALIKDHVDQNGGTLNDLDNIGILFLGLGLPDSAETYFLRALSSDPNFFYSTIGLGQCEYSRGNISDAIRIYEEVIQRKDLLPVERINILTRYSIHHGNTLAWFYGERGQIKKALAVFSDAMGLAINDPQYIDIVRERKARFLYSYGFYAGALRESSDQFRLIDARSFLALDSLDLAQELLASIEQYKGRNKHDEKMSVLQIEADLAIIQNNPALALRILDEMEQEGVPIGGQDAIDWRRSKAKAFKMAGRYDKAVEELHRLGTMFGSHSAVHYELGMVYEKMGRISAAIDEYEIFLERMSLADEGLKQVEDVRGRLARISGDRGSI